MAIQFYGRATAAVFAPLESSSRSELVARRLTDAIALGLLPDAKQLPGEADLAHQFGVSTVTIREALSVLRQEGLIETRRGRGGGSFVPRPGATASPTWPTAGSRTSAWSSSATSVTCTPRSRVPGPALAARRASAEDVAQLRRMAAPARRGPRTGRAAPGRRAVPHRGDRRRPVDPALP